MINKFIESKHGRILLKPEISLVLILLLITCVTAFDANSSSYTADTKFDFGLTDNATSTSYTSREISGFEVVGDYISSNFVGRFGILEDLTVVQGLLTNINSTDGTNRTGQDLNCFTTLTESNGNGINVSVKWYNSSVEYLSVDYSNNYANGTFFVDTLGSANTARGENWSCSLRTFNGVTYSNWTTSENLTIANSPPTIILSYPENGAVVMNTTPYFNWTGVDDDGDSLTYDFNISLVAASLCTDSDQFVENIATNNHTSSELNCYFDNGDYYVWSVRGKDNYSTGEWADSFNVSLTALVDVSFPVSSVSFGSIPFLGSNNTTDDSPPPFVIQNNGNSLVNVNISATDLWNAVGNPSSYYRLKVDNVSGEGGSFNWSGSSTDWVNAPKDNDTIIIYELNYPDATDSAELDIYVEVPSNETPSAKTSTVTFVASFAE